VAAVKSSDINDRLVKEAVIPGGTTPDAFASHIKAEYERMGRVIREAKIALD
jgi:tripartite-type tricarboxylate transporter receptor subunit TctC